MRSLLLPLFLLGAALPATVSAQSYTYEFASEPAGLVAQTGAAAAGTTIATPVLNGERTGYTFAFWKRDEVRQADTTGRAVPQVSFALTANTRLVAVYRPTLEDTDADGLPDWFELLESGSLALDATADPDGDGLPLATEFSRGLSSRILDTRLDGGVSSAVSGTFTFARAGDFAYRFTSRPQGLVESTGAQTAGSTVTSPLMHGATSGWRFAYWELNGTRQADSAGRATPQISFALTGPATAVAVFVGETADSDDDQIPDWYEWQELGSLATTANGDPDGDGLPLSVEWQRGLSARIVDTIVDGGVSSAMSAAIPFAGADGFQYTFTSQPPGLVSLAGAQVAGTTVTTPTLHGEKNGWQFAYWQLNGVRQADLAGMARPEVAFALTGQAAVVAVYVRPTDDTDADGIPDWYELEQNGDLGIDSNSDPDADGLKASVEFSRGYGLKIVDTLIDGGVSSAISPALTFIAPVATAPAITTQPESVTAYTGANATFTLTANAVPAPTYQWQWIPAGTGSWGNLADTGATSGSTTPTLTITSAALAMSGDQFRCVVTNPLGTATSEAVLLSVTKHPAIVTITGTAYSYDGTTKSATVTTVPAGLPTTITYDGTSTAPTAVGSYAVLATVNDPDYAGSAAATLVIAPAITPGQTGTVVRSAGGATTLSVSVTGSAAVAFQWQILQPATARSFSTRRPASDDLWIDIPGATASSYTLPSTQEYHSGNYRVVVTSNGVSEPSGTFTVQVDPPPASNARLLNLSTRALDLTGDNVLIPGFVISGTGTKRMLVRAVGPGLFDTFGLTGNLADPQLSLRNQLTGAEIASSDDWGTSSNAAAIATASAAVGAFPLLADSKDAVVLVDLPAGRYTAPTAGAAGGTGIAMVELYDVDGSSSTAQLVNISNRGFVDIGDKIMIPGFVVSNEGSRTFLMRAVGPGLFETFGLTGVLEDPVLTVFKGGNPILSNDDWGANAGSATTASTSAMVGAFPLSAGSKDAAFVVTLPPGGYTIQATGKNATTGIALVEVYLVP